MPTVTRARILPASAEEVWRVVSNPERLPGWWPGVARVEDVGAGAWTTVMESSRGKALRADYSRLSADPGQRIAWRHEVEESPFERILAESVTEIELTGGEGGGTRVRLTLRHRPRGWARFGYLQLRAAAVRQAEGALDGLAGLFGEAA
jgi:uncharacterized protein YndB with AHSA1/START domain